MQRFDKSLQALQSRVDQLEESKRDTVPAPKLDSKSQGSNGPSSGKTKEFRCYECDEPGHIARNCPKRSGQQRPARGNGGSSVRPEEAAAAAQPPIRGLSNDNRSIYLPVRIKRSRLQCTLDTGSDVTVVPLRMVRKFNLKITNSPMKQLKAANGTGITIEGVASPRFRLLLPVSSLGQTRWYREASSSSSSEVTGWPLIIAVGISGIPALALTEVSGYS